MDASTNFDVLIVDNGAHAHNKARRELAALEGVRVHSAHSVDEAADAMSVNFYRAMFIDLKLGRQRGTSVIRNASVLSPTCAIFVMTKYLSDFAQELVSLLSQPSFSLSALVNKVEGPTTWFERGVRRLFDDWHGRRVRLTGLGEVVSAVSERAERIDGDLRLNGNEVLSLRRDTTALASELEYLFVEIFGQMGAGVEDERPTLNLRVLRRGFSSSIVVEVLPYLRLPRMDHELPGNRCVVKIGPRPEIEAEATRYERVVRFGVALDYRVELMGLARGDALAAVCYSFAGGNLSDLTSFDDLLIDQDSDGWKSVLDQVFSKEASNWYSVSVTGPSLRDYFADEIGSELRRCYRQLVEYVEFLGTQPSARLEGRGTRLRLGSGVVIPIPREELLADERMVDPVPACLIHGDLHGGNIMVASPSWRPYLIDYRNAGIGPRLLDFAALQATTRFAHVATMRPESGWPRKLDEGLLGTIGRIYDRELGVVKRATAATDWWAAVVAKLEEASFRNFQHERDEALWSNLAYGLSLFRFVHMEWYRKVRLLTWVAATAKTIEDIARRAT
ncbi:phosphotransferase [Geodermatophilus sp. URMC 64]